MKNSQNFVNGLLTLIDPTSRTILGELVDARWNEEETPNGRNHVFSGLAGDGTIDTLETFMASGADTVDFVLSDGKNSYQGQALLLKPDRVREPSGTEVRIESADAPLQLTV